jgi:hypothetical protein
MKTPRAMAVARAAGKAAVAAGLSTLLLFSLFASSNAGMHLWLHDDAESSSHHCLVTTLADGESVQAPASGEFIALPVFTAQPPQTPEIVLHARVELLPASRAPPFPS